MDPDSIAGWTLDEIDFVPAAGTDGQQGGRDDPGPATPSLPPRVLRGRSLLTAGIASTAADAARQALTDASRAGGSGPSRPACGSVTPRSCTWR